MSTKVLTNRELECLLSAHAAGQLSRGDMSESRYCVLEALADFYDVPWKENYMEAWCTKHKVQPGMTVWMTCIEVFQPFDNRYRRDMTPEEFLSLWV